MWAGGLVIYDLCCRLLLMISDVFRFIFTSDLGNKARQDYNLDAIKLTSIAKQNDYEWIIR